MSPGKPQHRKLMWESNDNGGWLYWTDTSTINRPTEDAALRRLHLSQTARLTLNSLEWEVYILFIRELRKPHPSYTEGELEELNEQREREGKPARRMKTREQVIVEYIAGKKRRQVADINDILDCVSDVQENRANRDLPPLVPPARLKTSYRRALRAG